jgi:hypothetical protein
MAYTDISFSMFRRLEVLVQVPTLWVLVRNHFLVYQQLLSLHPNTVENRERDRRKFCVSSSKELICSRGATLTP